MTQQQRCDKEPDVEFVKSDGTPASVRDMLEGVSVGVLLLEVGSGGGPEEFAYEADDGGRKDEQRQGRGDESLALYPIVERYCCCRLVGEHGARS